MTWRGDGGSEGLRTIVPPIVDRLVSFGLALREVRNLTKPEVQKSNLGVENENCAKSEQMQSDTCHCLSFGT